MDSRVSGDLRQYADVSQIDWDARRLEHAWDVTNYRFVRTMDVHGIDSADLCKYLNALPRPFVSS